ncbi:MAG: tetratricopeptide repeat protein [Thermodesulfobacteriota bacterium]|nr:MAG: tetratricopeptide repeat protein [Thermodesulfobacteriota bacterium]
MLSALRVVFPLILAFSFLSCGLGADRKFENHMRKGKASMEAAKYREAVLEFKNASKANPDSAEARYLLGTALMSSGGAQNMQLAYREFGAAADLDPGLMDAQLKMGEFMLLLRDFDGAREKARLVLGAEPERFEAKMLLSGALAAGGDHASALSILDELIASRPGDMKTYMAAASIHMSRKDLRRAEAVLRRAVEADSGSLEARIALADIYLGQGKRDEAQAEMEKAVELNMESQDALLALGSFYHATGRPGEAENTFNSAIRLKPESPKGYIALSDFLAASGRKPEEAAEVLEKGIQKSGDLALRKKLSALRIDTGALKEAGEEIESILEKSPRDHEGLFLRGKLLLAKRDFQGAIGDLKASLKANPLSAQAHFALGLAYQADGNAQTAKTEFLEALRIAPGLSAARLALAAAYLGSDELRLAAEEAQKVLAKSPDHPGANLLMGDISLKEKKYKEATVFFRKTIKSAPADARGHVRLGMALELLGERKAALDAFERAYAKDPRLLNVLSMITSIHIAEKNAGKALARVGSELERYPDNPHLHHLLGRLYMLTKDSSRAEDHFKKTLRLKSDLIAVYLDLGSLYALRGSLDEAVRQYNEAVRLDPDLVSGHMMLAVLHEKEGRKKEAVASYKKALEINPSFVPAANNLAWLYAEGEGNIDVALSLAETAKSLAPEDPNVSDTLGWIYYKKGVYMKAISLLRESAEKEPDNPVIRYHLGMAYHKKGDAALAERELKKALGLKGDFQGSEEAREVLGNLK